MTSGRQSRRGVLNCRVVRVTARGSVFLATDLAADVPHRDPEERDMQSAWFTRSQVESMMRDGTISDSKTIAAYALLLIS